jgi:hypothetical protein
LQAHLLRLSLEEELGQVRALIAALELLLDAEAQGPD